MGKIVTSGEVQVCVHCGRNIPIGKKHIFGKRKIGGVCREYRLCPAKDRNKGKCVENI